MPPVKEATERKRRFTPKVKTGCFNCRRRRIKCPEQLPICKRCEIANLICEYPYNKNSNSSNSSSSSKRAAVEVTSTPQPRSPSAVAVPDGAIIGDGDADLFGSFCSAIVHVSGGMFNHQFWHVDVPRAALTYPAVWHAGIALAAIHLCVRKSSKIGQSMHAAANIGVVTGAGASKAMYSSSVPRNHQYLQALSHFHKSIQHLSKTLSARCPGGLTYADQEMAIMTNILFIGITSMLEDPQQIQSHYRNLFLLLESFRFGDDDDDDHDKHTVSTKLSRARRGIMDHDDLRSLVLSLEASYPYTHASPWEGEYPWVVKIPRYDQFTSVTQAYTEIMITTLGRLSRLRPRLATAGQQVPEGPTAILRALRGFEAKLEAFEQSAVTANSLSRSDRDAIEFMRHQVRFRRTRVLGGMQTSRQGVLDNEQQLLPVLEYLEQQHARRAASCLRSREGENDESTTKAVAPVPPPPFVFSASLGQFSENFLTGTSLPMRLRALDMIRKWPYKEGGSRSEESLAIAQAIIAHEQSGPSRTRASQLAGKPIVPRFHNGGLQDRQFDGTRECECLSGVYVCREHMVADWRVDISSSRPANELASEYEVRNGLPYTPYYF